MTSFEPSVNLAQPEDIQTVAYYVLLDFDRCLGDTSQLQAQLETVLSRYNKTLSLDDMRGERERTEAIGGSFDTVDWIQRQLDSSGHPEVWRDIVQRFVQTSLNGGDPRASQALMPGASELLHYLEDQKIPHGFLTYGGRDWQEAKLRATGLVDLPRLIIDYRQKGQLIRSWRQSDGSFVLPAELSAQNQPLKVQKLAFLDDKADSFIGIPPHNTLLIQVNDERSGVLPSQQGVVAQDVLHARNLSEATRHIRQFML